MLRRFFSYFGGSKLSSDAENVQYIPWRHGNNRKYDCFGDDLHLQIDDAGPYTIVEVRDPELERYLGRRISVHSRNVTSTLTGLLRFVDELLTECDIPHWINSGTLLGAWRQGAVVPWDNDADMMIRAQDAELVLALQGRIEEAGYIFTSNKLYGPTYKMYVKSADTPKIMVELCSMHPHAIDVPGIGSDILWTYHPKMVETVAARVERIYKEDPTNEIAQHRYNQRKNNDILIDNQYLDSEIFPLQRIPFGGVAISGPARPKTILQRDYGAYGLTHGLISCACQWTDGDYLLKVAIEPCCSSEEKRG